MSMTHEQIAIVQTTFRSVQTMGATAAELFYRRLFSIEPTVTPMFTRDLEHQGREFLQVMAVAVGGLGNTSVLVPIIQQLGVRHVNYGVRAEHYDRVREALLWMLEMILQDAFTPQVRSAWATAYAMLAGIMKEAAWGEP